MTPRQNIADILRDMETNGTLQRLVNVGFVPVKTKIYYEIFLEYDKQRRTTKKQRLQIICDIATQFRMSERQIYRALKIFMNENGNFDPHAG